jgi:hypothetical protein
MRVTARSSRCLREARQTDLAPRLKLNVDITDHTIDDIEPNLLPGEIQPSQERLPFDGEPRIRLVVDGF